MQEEPQNNTELDPPSNPSSGWMTAAPSKPTTPNISFPPTPIEAQFTTEQQQLIAEKLHEQQPTKPPNKMMQDTPPEKPPLTLSGTSELGMAGQDIEPFWGTARVKTLKTSSECFNAKWVHTRMHISASNSEDKTSWTKLSEAFRKRWLKKMVVTKTELEYEVEIMGSKLETKDLLKKEVVAGREVYKYIAWTDHMLTLTMGAKVTAGTTYLNWVRKELPQAIRDQTTGSYTSWIVFLEAVQNANVDLIRDKVDEWEGQPDTLTEHELSILRANLTALPHHPDTPAGHAAHQAQQQEFARQHGTSTFIKFDTPYPLHPGTAGINTGECYKCGTTGHRSLECMSATSLHIYEQKWRRYAGFHLQQARSTPVNIVAVDDYGTVWQVADVGTEAAQHQKSAEDREVLVGKRATHKDETQLTTNEYNTSTNKYKQEPNICDLYIIAFHGPQGEVVRAWGTFDDGALVGAICSKLYERVKHRMGLLAPSAKRLRMANRVVVRALGRWTGIMEINGVKAEGTLEVFDSGGNWEVLLGKPLIEAFRAVLGTDMDGSEIHLRFNLRIET
ncbi:hypothetical protein BDQ17DRAFT_1441526 [Cyathus striatus]|nr:hypothetical protein BDQ17DRAFT_1441526 [Cyathus striatus]